MIKGKLINKKGDVTSPQRIEYNEIVIIPHCCNNENRWGAGVTLSISQKWSLPEQKYRDFCKTHQIRDLPILGKVCFVEIENDIIVANMIGQDGIISKNNPIPIKYKALVNCMAEVAAYIDMIKSKTIRPVVIHAPKFGSDLAKGNFEFILELIREIWIEEGINVVIYTYIE